MSFWRRPQTTRLRRVLFQVHLWTGLAVGLYAVLIGVTGTVLTFRGELQQNAYPQFFAPRPPGTALADPSVVIASLEASYPAYRFSGIDFPTYRRGTFLAYLSRGEDFRTVFADPVSGRVIGELPKDGWIQRLQELHFNLLAGRTGIVINGIAATCLLLLCLTGLPIWWQGVQRWTRGLAVAWSRGWRRVTWELHGAIGIWTVVLLLIWSVSGIYFSFPSEFRDVVARVAPLSPYRTMMSVASPVADAPAASALLKRAKDAVPGAQLARFVVPVGERGTYQVVLASEIHGDDDASDEVTVYFDRYSGDLPGTYDLGRRTAGDALLSWLGRLHVGSFGGRPIQLVWAIAGLAFPMLFVTGAVMWWNRKVRASIALDQRPAIAGR